MVDVDPYSCIHSVYTPHRLNESSYARYCMIDFHYFCYQLDSTHPITNFELDVPLYLLCVCVYVCMSICVYVCMCVFVKWDVATAGRCRA